MKASQQCHATRHQADKSLKISFCPLLYGFDSCVLAHRIGCLAWPTAPRIPSQKRSMNEHTVLPLTHFRAGWLTWGLQPLAWNRHSCNEWVQIVSVWSAWSPSPYRPRQQHLRSWYCLPLEPNVKISWHAYFSAHFSGNEIKYNVVDTINCRFEEWKWLGLC